MDYLCGEVLRDRIHVGFVVNQWLTIFICFKDAHQFIYFGRRLSKKKEKNILEWELTAVIISLSLINHTVYMISGQNTGLTRTTGLQLSMKCIVWRYGPFTED